MPYDTDLERARRDDRNYIGNEKIVVTITLGEYRELVEHGTEPLR